MAPYARQNTYPYVVTWQGAIAPLRPFRGHVSGHKRPDLAIKRAEKDRNAIRDLWGAWPPWFVWRVVDVRTGEVVKIIR